MNDTLMYALVGVGTFLLATKRGGSGGASGGLKANTGSGGTSSTDALLLKLVQVASAEEALKVREETYNSDTGYRIDEYQKLYGMRGSLWCAAFVGWCITSALGRTRPPRWCGASTSGFMAAARDAYRKGLLPAEYVAFGREPATLSRIKPGWVWVTGSTANGSDPLEAPAGGWNGGHTGIVINPVSAKAGHFQTVEGNTCVGSNCNGGGVFFAQRPYVRPATDKRVNVIWFDPMALTAVLEAAKAKADAEKAAKAAARANT